MSEHIRLLQQQVDELKAACQRKDKLILELWEWFGSSCNALEFCAKEKKFEARIKAEGIK